MSATISELEALDNATLRAKCLEFGLPNVPITDTSRKILIKKLSLAMSGGDANKSQTNKQRRETIHATKIPVPAENSSSTSNENEVDAALKRPPSRASARRTMAVPTSSATVNNTNETDDSVKLLRQKAATPDLIPNPVPVAAPLTARRQSVGGDKVTNIRALAAEKRKTIVIEEDDEDDVILVEAAENEEKTRPKAIPRSRDSRSISLSKSGVVTTSYNREVASSKPPTINETESENEGIAESYVKSYDNPRSAYSHKDRTVLLSSGREYSQSSLENFYPEYNVNSMRSSANRTSAEPETYKNKFTSRYSTQGSYFPSQPNYMASTSRRYTTNPVSTHSYNENSDDQDEYVKPENTPYLSTLVQTLAQLKENSLSAQDSLNQNLPPRYSSKVSGRSAPNTKESINESFWNLFHALNHKYDISTKLAIFACVIGVLFIYFVFVR